MENNVSQFINKMKDFLLLPFFKNGVNTPKKYFSKKQILNCEIPSNNTYSTDIVVQQDIIKNTCEDYILTVYQNFSFTVHSEKSQNLIFIFTGMNIKQLQLNPTDYVIDLNIQKDYITILSNQGNVLFFSLANLKNAIVQFQLELEEQIQIEQIQNIKIVDKTYVQINNIKIKSKLNANFIVNKTIYQSFNKKAVFSQNSIFLINSAYGVIKFIDLNHTFDYYDIKPNKNLENTNYKLNTYIFFIEGNEDQKFIQKVYYGNFIIQNIALNINQSLFNDINIFYQDDKYLGLIGDQNTIFIIQTDIFRLIAADYHFQGENQLSDIKIFNSDEKGQNLMEITFNSHKFTFKLPNLELIKTE